MRYEVKFRVRGVYADGPITTTTVTADNEEQARVEVRGWYGQDIEIVSTAPKAVG